MSEGDRIHTSGDGIPEAPQQQPPKVRQLTSLRRVADKLLDGSRVCANRERFSGYRRYVPLNTQELFNALVQLYEILLHTQWQRFKRYVDSYNPGAHAQQFAARRYISCWFHDLYVSNRDSARRLTPIAFQEHFSHEEVLYSDEYDIFLAMLNAHIRPTNIVGTPESTLWVPIIANVIDWDTENPFGITNYDADFCFTKGLIDIMKDSKNWGTQNLVTSTTGRPSWLLDWHNERAYAWFSAEGNYSDEDLAVAYIVGVACTPKLGIRDVDEWQSWENNQIPAEINVSRLNRVVANRWHGGYEVRTIDQRELDYYYIGETPSTPAPIIKKKGKTAASKSKAVAISDEPRASKEKDKDKSSSSQEPHLVTINQFQITDWTYHMEVLQHVELHSRTGALRSLILL
nr:coat protein [Galphimia cryptic virus]